MKEQKNKRESIANAQNVTNAIKDRITKENKGQKKEGLNLSNIAQKLANRREKTL